MRIEPKSRMDKVRAEARLRVDAHFSRLTPERNPHLLAIHQRKTLLALDYLNRLKAFEDAGGEGDLPTPPMLLAEEAALRGDHIVELCKTIVTRSAESSVLLDNLERERQRLEHSIRNAQTADDLESIVNGIGQQLRPDVPG